MAEWNITGHPDGTITLGRVKPAIQEYLRKYDHPIRLTLQHDAPESGAMRRYYHGAVIPLWVYLDGKDHRSAEVRRDYTELAKIEFNGQILYVNGQERRIGRSTKGSAILGPHLETVIAYLEENYAIDRTRCLDPEHYKTFISTIYMHGKYDTYIDFLLAEGRLPANRPI
jgi:hypothetical protein